MARAMSKTESEILAESDAIYLDTNVLPKVDIEEDGASNLARILIYMTGIPVYCSLVGLGEFFHVAGKKVTQARIGPSGYLYGCRALLKDIEIGQIRLVEPVADRFEFIKLANALSARHISLGGGDIWHIMAALQLQSDHERSALFSFDDGLVDAARAEGVNSVNGNNVASDALIRELSSRGKWISAQLS